MAYRNDLEALEARRAALEAEIAERTRERDEAAQLIAEARAREEAETTRCTLESTSFCSARPITIAVAVMAVTVIAGIGRLLESSPTETLYQQYAHYADEMCACTTRACADDVLARVERWLTDADVPADKATVERFTRVADRMVQCSNAIPSRIEVDQYGTYESQSGGVNGRSNDNDSR